MRETIRSKRFADPVGAGQTWETLHRSYNQYMIILGISLEKL